MVQAALTRAQQRRNQEVAGWVRWVVRRVGPPHGSPGWVPPVGPPGGSLSFLYSHCTGVLVHTGSSGRLRSFFTPTARRRVLC